MSLGVTESQNMLRVVRDIDMQSKCRVARTTAGDQIMDAVRLDEILEFVERSSGHVHILH